MIFTYDPDQTHDRSVEFNTFWTLDQKPGARRRS